MGARDVVALPFGSLLDPVGGAGRDISGLINGQMISSEMLVSVLACQFARGRRHIPLHRFDELCALVSRAFADQGSRRERQPEQILRSLGVQKLPNRR